MNRRPKRKLETFVPADSYPALLPKSRRGQAMQLLRSSEALDKANRVIAMKTAELRAAVLEHVEQIEAAAVAQDWSAVFGMAHEIRGLAATAGLAATGRIANGLCRYLDAIGLYGAQPDPSVTALHLDAILRSARTEHDTALHGATVAEQLASLVDRKLVEIKEATTI